MEKLNNIPPGEDYYALDRMSNSGMKHFKRSPRHYLYSRLFPVEPTPAMIYGNAFHTMVLEPHQFEDRYIFEPKDGPKRPTVTQIKAEKPTEKAKESIDFWAAFDAKAEGRTILTLKDKDRLEAMLNSLHDHHDAWQVLNECTQTERSLLWIDPETGVECKGKMDADNEDITVDLKTCENANPGAFAIHAFNMDYHRQAAFYSDARTLCGFKKKGDFYFIAIEKEAPYGVSLMKATRDFISHGRHAYTEILEDYAHWLQMGSPDVDYQWKASPFGHHELHLPPWIR